jgi:hypothetical protein
MRRFLKELAHEQGPVLLEDNKKHRPSVSECIEKLRRKLSFGSSSSGKDREYATSLHIDEQEESEEFEKVAEKMGGREQEDEVIER